MSDAQVILGPFLNPRPDGSVDYVRDGALACDERGLITYVGPADACPQPLAVSPRRSAGILLPPFLDAHTHIPQHPIRGHFLDGVAPHPPDGRLIGGLNRNVFPAESKCVDPAIAEQIVRDFAADTLAKGVVGGAAYMTVHHDATRIALEQLGELWSVGLVLMEMNCPEHLRVEPATVIGQMSDLASAFGKRFIVTDRFAVAVGPDLRKRAAQLAWDRGLLTQTHLNEQVREKEFVERTLYPQYGAYANVYFQDGLLDVPSILAHCVHTTDDELGLLAKRDPFVAHCPTSNALLGSGIMPLDRIAAAGLEYAICTDVGASPTTSMLAEMAQYLKVHAGRSERATPSEALYRATLAPAMKLGTGLGHFAVGAPMSYLEVESFGSYDSADTAIRQGLLGLPADPMPRPELKRALDDLAGGRSDVSATLDLLTRDVHETADRLENRVIAVTLDGAAVWRRGA